jgi:diguanylate cyclase (GGDEF)-like protein
MFVPAVGWGPFLAWYLTVVAGLVARQVYFWYLFTSAQYLTDSQKSHALVRRVARICAVTGWLAGLSEALFATELGLTNIALLSTIVVAWTAMSVMVLCVHPRTYFYYVLANWISVVLGWVPYVAPYLLLGIGLSLMAAAFLLTSLARMMWHQQTTEFDYQRVSIDTLTGLPNRSGLCLEGDLRIRRGKVIRVLLLDVNRFKDINDALGYEFGDAVLREVGRSLQAIPNAVTGRVHASQFCMLVDSEEHECEVLVALEKISASPLIVAGDTVDIAFSSGVAEAGPHGPDMSSLLRCAAIAAHVASNQRISMLRYSVGMEVAPKADLRLLSDLKGAISEGQIQMYLQPKVRLDDGEVFGAEALMRWHHPVRGVVQPMEFIPFAERTGSIRMLTQWILHEALELVARERAAGRPLNVSVNVGAYDLCDEQLAQKARDLLEKTGADPRDICLEVTESDVMESPETVMQQLHRLSAMGFTLSVDDFGTGYSSLSYLQRMPVTELKIDRSFVNNERRVEERTVLLDSIIVMAHRLGLQVVAEGIENEEQWKLLAELHCDKAQGWYIARAMPSAQFAHWRMQHPIFRETT